MRSLKLYYAIALLQGFFIQAAAQPLTPVKTGLIKTDNGFTITRNGQPYFVKGAGGTNYMDRLANNGGNSVRTWNTRNAEQILNQATQLNLTVTLGLDAARERHGFNYNDTAAVRKQLERLRGEVRKYKNHPALLAWGIGNELNLEASNTMVWNAVNDIAQMIHAEDPNHLVTTMLAGAGKKEIGLIKERCPAIDFLSVQVYGGLMGVPNAMNEAGWNAPYMVTEWGPTGHWETMQTPWKASVEETSTEKANVYKTRYEASIKKDGRCLGSYVFLWGQKQERTPTWYGMFTEKGEATEVVDVMHYLWNNTYPENRAPAISQFLLNNQKATDVVYVTAAKTYPISLVASDLNNDVLAIRWELLHESTDLKNGGDPESRPEAIAGAVSTTKSNNYLLKAPKAVGAYRLFVYVSDGKNKVATANIPFYVREANAPVAAKN